MIKSILYTIERQNVKYDEIGDVLIPRLHQGTERDGSDSCFFTGFTEAGALRVKLDDNSSM